MSGKRKKNRGRKDGGAKREPDKTAPDDATEKPEEPKQTKPKDAPAKKKPPPAVAKPPFERILGWAFDPQPLIRLEIIRILAPLAILGFMSSRIAHPDDWLSDAGFVIPDLGGDWRQPVKIPPVPLWAAYAICVGLVTSGLATAAGFKTRISSAIFAVILFYVALADRLTAFTVSKLAPIVSLALCVTPSGTRYGVDAWRERKRAPGLPDVELVSGGCVRFFQILLPVFYASSGLCKAQDAWLTNPYVLWSHIHDSYQTPVSWWVGNTLPSWVWPVLQGITLIFEIGAPIWFSNRFTRPFALAWGLGMHTMIGLMFGPVIWFSLLMIVLLIGSYAPVRWLERPFRRAPKTRHGIGTTPA